MSHESFFELTASSVRFEMMMSLRPPEGKRVTIVVSIVFVFALAFATGVSAQPNRSDVGGPNEASGPRAVVPPAMNQRTAQVSAFTDELATVLTPLANTYIGVLALPNGALVRTTERSADLNALVEKVQSRFANLVVDWRTGEFSLARLAGITHQLSVDADLLEASGIRLTGWGPSVKDDAVRVSVENYSPEVADSLVRRYGPTVEVVPASRERPVETAGSRYNDTAPWYGGDALTAEKAGEVHCTSGFPIVDGFGRDAVVTGGHCFNTGVSIYTNQLKIGNVTNREYDQDGVVDGELIPAAGHVLGYVWDYDAGSTPSSLPVKGYRNTQEAAGGVVISAGAASNRTSRWVITETGQCFTFRSGHRTCDLAVGDSGDLVQVIEGGDSGGPVYEYRYDNQGFPNGVIAHGYVIGSAQNGSELYFAREKHLLGVYQAHLA